MGMATPPSPGLAPLNPWEGLQRTAQPPQPPLCSSRSPQMGVGEASREGPSWGIRLPRAALHSRPEKARAGGVLRGSEGRLLPLLVHGEDPASLPASLLAQPPLSPCTTAFPSLWLSFFLSFCPAFLPRLPCPSLSPQKAPELALGLWSFWPPPTLTVTPAPPCLSACLSISLSSQAPPGLPCAVQSGPLLSLHRGGRGEHGARGDCQEAGDHGEAGRGKAPGVSPTRAGSVQLHVTLPVSQAASFSVQG